MKSGLAALGLLARYLPWLSVVLFGLTLAWLANDWQENFSYKPFTRYLGDEVKWIRARWNEGLPPALP